jgi:sporulation protein YlmC with PRC-barrel domain
MEKEFEMTKFALAALLATTALMPVAATAQTTNPQPGAAARTENQARPVAVSQIKGKDVYTARGEAIGEVERVLLGEGNQNFAVVAFGEFLGLGGERRIVPLNRMSLREDRIIVPNMTEAEFKGLPAWRSNLTGYRELTDNQRVQIASYAGPAAGQQQAQAREGGGTDIVVRQPAPTVQVDQAAPQVTVQQPQPRVTVRQPQPEIIVRQAQPTVTVTVPQPEIVVRMPEPDVNVAMAPPQVQVHQPRPQVQVVQPQKPQVQVEPAQPQVLVQRPANAEPNVQIYRAEGQPEVRYERMGEPRVTVQAQGQPTVRYERMGADGQQAAKQPASAGGAGTANADRFATARERLGVNDVQATASVAGNRATRAMTVRQLEDMDVYNFRGEELGDIDRVIFDPTTQRRYAVVEHGGFLGIGEERVAFPLERFSMRGDRLYIRGVTEQDIEAMANFRERFANYRDLGDNDRLDVGVWE